MSAPALTALALAVGYIAGSIPFGVILTRLSGLGDIRAIGSGNIGATNVLRTGKKGLALATLLLDGGKGAAAVIAVGSAYLHGHADGSAAPGNPALWCAIAGIAAVIGHVFPVWLKFKGGKGVATALGVYLALAPVMGIAALLTWLVAAGISRRSSVGGMAATIAGPVAAILLNDAILAAATALIAVLVIARHAENIRRLIAGTEPKIGKSKP
jgi:glycerol-3-phosphate acyltransferase PlsY